MSRLLQLPALLLAAALLYGCDTEPTVTERTFLAFGTLVEVTVVGAQTEAAEAAIDAVQQDFEWMHATWHPWEASALSRVNMLLGTGEWFSAAPSVLPLLEAARKLERSSGGRFNPAIGKLVQLWGFDDSPAPDATPPPDSQIGALVQAKPSLADIERDGIRLRSTNPEVVLDFGAFAKGYAIDRAIALLQSHGIHNAIVNAGGDLRAIGSRGERAWRIGIRAPRGGGILASVEIRGDQSVFTSGDYERFFEFQGRRYHHILNPATGYPAEGITSVTVLTRQGARADAAATALFVAGPEHWPQVAADLGIDQVMVVRSDGRVQMTEPMRRHVQLEAENAPDVQVVALP